MWYVVRLAFRMLGQFPHDLALQLFAVLAGSIVSVTVPYMTGLIIDNVNKPMYFPFLGHDVRLVFFYVAGWFVVSSAEYFISFFVGYNTTLLQLKIEAEYLTRGLKKLLHLPIAFHNSHHIGETADAINQGSGWLETISVSIIQSMLPNFTILFLSLFFIFKINVTLSIVLVSSTFLFVLLLRFMPRFADTAPRENYRKIYGRIYDAIENVRAVKQAAAEDYETNTMRTDFYEKAIPPYQKFHQKREVVRLFQQAITTIAYGVVFVMGINLVDHGALTIGGLVAFNMYTSKFFTPFTGLFRDIQQIHRGMVEMRAAEKIFEEPEEAYKPAVLVEMKDVVGHVALRNVTFRYAENPKPILKNVSFTVHPGHIVAIVGSSGIGKTTIVDLLTAFYHPQKGSILIDGVDLKNVDLAQYRSHIAIVPQDIVLFNESIEYNIKYGSFDASHRDVVSAATDAYADKFIRSFPKKYHQEVGERGIKLSGGQKQRIAIARAILRDPKILILDEPTSALDAWTEREVVTALEKLMTGRTTFIIAHRLATVKKADSIIVLDGGRVVETGTHAQLIKKRGLYRKLYELQKL